MYRGYEEERTQQEIQDERKRLQLTAVKPSGMQEVKVAEARAEQARSDAEEKLQQESRKIEALEKVHMALAAEREELEALERMAKENPPEMLKEAIRERLRFECGGDPHGLEKSYQWIDHAMRAQAMRPVLSALIQEYQERIARTEAHIRQDAKANGIDLAKFYAWLGKTAKENTEGKKYIHFQSGRLYVRV